MTKALWTKHVEGDRSGRSVGFLRKRPDRHDPGVVDEHVNGANGPFDPLHEGRKRFCIRDIETPRTHTAAELRRSVLGRFDVTVSDCYLHTEVAERPRRGPRRPRR